MNLNEKKTMKKHPRVRMNREIDGQARKTVGRFDWADFSDSDADNGRKPTSMKTNATNKGIASTSSAGITITIVKMH